jgi:hypothetical protein
MKRYQAFARQAELPPITVTNNSTIKVGTVETDTARLAELSVQDKEALAEQFKVPPSVIDKVAQRIANSPDPAADQLAQELRTAVIDYRFLRLEWDRYHPPVEGQPLKIAALAALQAGDVIKAWELYDGLRKPQPPAAPAPAPPANLRVVAQP